MRIYAVPKYISPAERRTAWSLPRLEGISCRSKFLLLRSRLFPYDDYLVAIDFRNAHSRYSFEFLFRISSLHPLPACAVHFVGCLRRRSDTFSPGPSLASYRFSYLGNFYGTAALAVSPDSVRELAGSQSRSRAILGWVSAPLPG